ncbi:sulfite exporter TauE/SafE family protein [Chryseosolibacter indicus]|uniref:Probable membrane transporter protein n=1 Tax=Chryseosolibacter indicus TaxID=2782351 RepID=A0ABS5VS19_9BACT|nr:sulfite exporter TauE/SafE family protein [Chryseosolibacter indicus]MBT1704230.1 sulfite exporter TauE/SafE family protein [Chryseosolibacter indicus]
MIDLFSFSFSFAHLLLFFLVALLIGMSKTGVHGAGMLAVPLLAVVFGGQRSSGIMLPILCIADVLGVWYYHRHASWHHLRRLFPWAALGTLMGTLIGGSIDDHMFKMIMAVIILLSVIIMIWLQRHKEDIPDNYWFATSAGVIGGFTSMIGNLAGSVMAVYFLAMRLPKNTFIGTSAWFFLVMNWFKVPFHVFSWKTITVNSFLLNLSALPVIALGAYFGIIIIRNINEKTYRWFIITMTLIASCLMLLS